ncbi:MAG: hypothetical protein CTY10_06430 [Methylotenera sp.]|nr:MAG: hypothetical protein CTY10_06430 [Methylotenera sp.]
MKTLTINNLEFAQSAQSVTGVLDILEMDRLADVLLIQEAMPELNIQFTLAGHNKKYSLPSLHLSIDAHLPTTCQRCLNAMSVSLKLEFDYLITDNEPAEYDESDDLDWLEISPVMSVPALVEDELLIAFPIAPTHSSEQQGECKQHTMESGEKPNPFAALKDLTKKSS